MSKSELSKPSESELEILQILWAAGASTVREVNERLNEEREVGYTTTLKIMQIMVTKGLLERDTTKRTHVYTAKIAQKETQKSLLNRFVEKAFSGSAGKLVMQALGNHKTSKEELAAIKALIEKIEKEN